MKSALLITAACLLVTSQANAESIKNGWGGEASLSGSTTSGNTQTTDIGIALHLTKEDGPWTNKLDTTYDLGKSSGIDTKNRWYIGYQLNREINEQLYVYGNANYFNDDFGAYQQGTFIGTGFGYKIIQSEPTQWNVEGGVGYRSQKLQPTDLISAISQNEFAVRAASNFTYQFNDAVSLNNKSEVIWSDTDTYLWNDIGITANLAGNLAARLSFKVDHHTDVPFSTKKTDTITRGALVYTLK